MRPATRLLANVKAARFLEPYSPTGLTGLFTHPAPRSALIYLYSTTLERLKQLPDSSVYRQSTESLTRSRLKVVESIKPEGYDGWAERARKKVSENPDVFNSEEGNLFQDGASHVKVERDGRSFISTKVTDNVDERVEEWDGERDEGAEQEGPSTTTRDADSKAVQRPIPETERETIPWEPEPPLDANQ
ncbi:MAG: hypothetical protein M1837_001605 [Sclerophora amabilis]|nr:MAG: hypothetical protein M1837_001605 [Sclerophora amabilis]